MRHRLLHLADLHLDRAFASMGCQGDLARRRRQGLRDALVAAGRLATERGCVAVTIGGDLYEHERAGADTARFLAETFDAWRPLQVLIAPGNHDALLPGSLYRTTAWPDNVTVFGEPRFEPVSVADGLTVWGLAHREPAWPDDPLQTVPATLGPGVHLALFHGAELGSRPDGKSIHGPFHAGDIRARGFDAALCGHYHRRRLDEATGLLYPGTPEPLGFDEEGARGPVIVEVSDAGTVGFAAEDTNRWWAATARCSVEHCGSLESVIAAAESACALAARDGARERTMVRVDLTGAVDSEVSLDVYTIETSVRERLEIAVVKVRDLTTPLIDAGTAGLEESTRGAFIRAAATAIEAAAGEEERALLEDAVRYGLMALSGAEIGLR